MDALDTSFYYNNFLLNNDLFSDVFVPPSDAQLDLALCDLGAYSQISSPEQDCVEQCPSNDSLVYLTKRANDLLEDPACRAFSCAPRKRGRPPLDKTARKCTNCGTNSTPEWRKGPSGPHTLCNACGLHFMKSQRRERHARKKQALKAEVVQQKRQNEVNAQGMIVPSLEILPASQTQALLQAQQAQADAQAFNLAQAQAQAQLQAQEEQAKAIEMAQNQAQIHAQIQAFLNASDSEFPMPALPPPVACFQDTNAIAHDIRLQAAFASLSAALQLTPETFQLMSGGSSM